MKNIALIISYRGDEFFGWQKQPGIITVQGTIEEAIKKITGEDVNLIGASRTDRGVHSLCQVANFLTTSNIPITQWQQAISYYLPKSIIIKKAVEVHPDFNARFHAKSKTYMFVVDNSTQRNVLLEGRVFHFPYNLDYDKILLAREVFVGEKDFKALAAKKRKKPCEGSQITQEERENTIRTIYEVQIVKKSSLIFFYIKGNSFLYKMVRNLVGTLLDIGRGKISIEQIKEGLQKKDRKLMGFCAPPHALYLYSIEY